MAKHHLKDAELEVRRVLDGPVRMNTAYGPVIVPTGHFVINFPGEFELATAVPPDVFAEMFTLTDDDRAEWGIDAEPNPGEQPTKLVNTATGEAVIGVAGDFPPDRPDTQPQSPPSGIGPGATTPIGEPFPPNPEEEAPAEAQTTAAPSDADVDAWAAGHYSARYRRGVATKLKANPTRAGELLAKHPLPAAEGQEAPPAAASIIAEPDVTAVAEPEAPAQPEGFPEPEEDAVPEIPPAEPAAGEPTS